MNNYISQNIVGCNYLSMPNIHDSNANVLMLLIIYPTGFHDTLYTYPQLGCLHFPMPWESFVGSLEWRGMSDTCRPKLPATRLFFKLRVTVLLRMDQSADSPHKGPVMEKAFPWHDVAAEALTWAEIMLFLVKSSSKPKVFKTNFIDIISHMITNQPMTSTKSYPGYEILLWCTYLRLRPPYVK